MKALVLAALLLPSVCLAQWTGEQKALAAVAAVALVADWRQTVTIANSGGVYFEQNPLLGKNPSAARVNRHFVLTALGASVALHYMPSEYRTVALRVLTVLEVGIVAHNYSLGLNVRF